MKPDQSATHQRTIQVAAIQLEAVIGDVAENLRRVEKLITEAAVTKPQAIAIPEFFTSRIAFDSKVHEAVLPCENIALDMLRRLASKHQCWIGGSMLVEDNGGIFNRYHLVGPTGQRHIHDKDLPTMWENAFYQKGDDGGDFDTPLGRIGTAMCWELIRTQTVRRLRDQIDFAMTGTHWWTLPSNWGGWVDRWLGDVGQYNRYLSENAPIEFARHLGVPVIQASHCGDFRSGFPVLPGLRASLPYQTSFVGCTQIVDAAGYVLAGRRVAEGPGVVRATINPGLSVNPQPIPNRFWLPKLPAFLRAYWHQQNISGKTYYRLWGHQAGLRNTANLCQRESVE